MHGVLRFGILFFLLIVAGVGGGVPVFAQYFSERNDEAFLILALKKQKGFLRKRAISLEANAS